MIRQLLDVETRCEFLQGSIEDLEAVLGSDGADIVICTGLFHHLSSTSDGVASLHAICREFLFLETICFPATWEDEHLRDTFELKDLPYFFGKNDFGITGHKLESGYYDGSATKLSVVGIPSMGALKMFLDVGGFTDVNVEIDPTAYSNAVAGGWRSFSAVCITASPRTSPISATYWVEEYEGGLVRTLLPVAVTEALYRIYCQNGRVETSDSPFVQLVVDMISGNTCALDQIQSEISNKYIMEILKNMRHAPYDKITLEYGKCLIASGNYELGEQVLFLITKRLNADWRSVYRAFCIIAWSCRKRGNATVSSRYASLCRVTNPQFPSKLLDDTIDLYELK